MELVSQTIRVIVSGDKVRIGNVGILPVFSVSNVVNLVTNREQSHAYGINYVNTVLKEKHPHLYSQIIPYKFSVSQRNSPCMDMFVVLKTLATIQCDFTRYLNTMAMTGLLQAEAGDRGLLEYVLRNAASDSVYRKFLRLIMWAEKNKESAVKGIGPVYAEEIAAVDEPIPALQATTLSQEYFSEDGEFLQEQSIPKPSPQSSTNSIFSTIQIPNNSQFSSTVCVPTPVNYQRSVAIQIPINLQPSRSVERAYPRIQGTELMVRMVSDSILKMNQQSVGGLEALFERMTEKMQQQSVLSEERILRMSKEREEMAMKASKENEENFLRVVKVEAELKAAEFERKLVEERHKAERAIWEHERRTERLLGDRDDLLAKCARLAREQTHPPVVDQTQLLMTSVTVPAAVPQQSSTSTATATNFQVPSLVVAAQPTISRSAVPVSNTATIATQKKTAPRKWFCMVYGGPMFDPVGFNKYVATTEIYTLNGCFQVLKMQNAVDEGKHHCLLTLNSDKGETCVNHVINGWIEYNKARGRGRTIVHELYNKRKGDVNRVIEIIEAARALYTLYEWPSAPSGAVTVAATLAAATLAARRAAIGDGDDDE